MNWVLEETRHVGFYSFCSLMASQRDWVMSTPHYRKECVCGCVFVRASMSLLPTRHWFLFPNPLLFVPFPHQAVRSSTEALLNPFDFTLLLWEPQSSGVSLRDMADSSGRSAIHKWPCIKLQNKHLALHSLIWCWHHESALLVLFQGLCIYLM